MSILMCCVLDMSVYCYEAGLCHNDFTTGRARSRRREVKQQHPCKGLHMQPASSGLGHCGLAARSQVSYMPKGQLN